MRINLLDVIKEHRHTLTAFNLYGDGKPSYRIVACLLKGAMRNNE